MTTILMTQTEKKRNRFLSFKMKIIVNVLVDVGGKEVHGFAKSFSFNFCIISCDLDVLR